MSPSVFGGKGSGADLGVELGEHGVREAALAGDEAGLLEQVAARGDSNIALPPVWKFVATIDFVPPRTLPSVKAIFSRYSQAGLISGLLNFSRP